MAIDYQKELNPEQLEAVEHELGPALVIVGAGSGKTRILVYRLARLMEKGIAPINILLLTFTRKAAATMLERAAQLTGRPVEGLMGGTFHAFAFAMLRRYARYSPFPSGFSVMDRADTQALLKMLMKDVLDVVPRGFPSAGGLASMVGKVRSLSGSPAELLMRLYPHLEPFHGEIMRLMEAYDHYKLSHGMVDYDDLLLHWRRLLQEHPQLRQEMADRFQFIMVDEYQDTNPVQAEMVALMGEEHGNVMAVGDDAQSIYSFRGADFRNIMEFPKIFPGARVITLVRNYRTTQPILDCTNAIIANAREKFSKQLRAARRGGRPPICYFAQDEEDQAAFVTGRIADALAAGFPAGEIAVLFRASYHSFRLEAHLQRAGIPFVKRGGMKLLEAAHVKDLLSFLRLLVNPRDRLSWHRLLTLLEGIGPKTAARIMEAALAADAPLEMVAEYPSKARWAAGVKALGRALLTAHGTPGVEKAMEAAMEWYRPIMEARFPLDHPRRSQELDQLALMGARYSGLEEFLADMALEPPEGQEQEADGVVLSTIHSAKGLEWSIVFIISLCEGRFPPTPRGREEADMEEERRLFYVATTRTKDQLFLVIPEMVSVSGGGAVPASPSRFFEEIPANLLTVWAGGRPCLSRRRLREPAPASPSEEEHGGPSGLAPGQRVRHPIFGPGVVDRIISAKKVRVAFDCGGAKTLHLDYARLSRL